MRGARTARRGLLRHDRVALARKCSRASATIGAQTSPSVGLASTVAGSVADDAGVAQRLARQIEPAERGILVEIAQDIGELQRAAEMMRERQAGLARHAEDPHRKPADRAGDAVAIEVERRAIGRADIGDDVHLHAVDDGEEILALEIELLHRLRQAGQAAAAMPA